MKKYQGAKFIIPLLLASVFLAVALCVFGSAKISFSQVIAAVEYQYFGMGEKVGNHGAIVNLRLMRTLLAYLTGAALSLSGAAMQAVFGNPLADPHILGVSSGAALGAAVATVFSLQMTALGLGAVSLCAFLGALLAALTVLFVARVNGRTGTTGLLLSGVAMGAFLSAMLSGLLAFHKENAESVYMWTMGSFSGATASKVTLCAAATIVGFVLLECFSGEMNILLMGDREAAGLGVNVRSVRVAVLLITTLLTSVVISMCGIVGFVGLMIPHAARRLTGPNHRTLLPVSALLGGIFLMVMDTLSRSLFTLELPVGVLTSLLGGPFFLYMLKKNRTGKGGRARAAM